MGTKTICIFFKKSWDTKSNKNQLLQISNIKSVQKPIGLSVLSPWKTTADYAAYFQIKLILIIVFNGDKGHRKLTITNSDITAITDLAKLNEKP